MTGDELEEVLSYLEETPAEVGRLAGEFAVQELRWKPSADEFSALEQVCHLRDIEREGYSVRIRKILNEDRPELPDLDGGRLAAERDYNTQDFETSLEEFARVRAESLGAIRGLRPEQLLRDGTLEGVGPITLERLLLLMRDHDHSHRDELASLRRAVVSSQ